VNVNEFKQRLEKIPLVAAGMGSPVKRREPQAVTALCTEALYSISLNGDLVSRRLADEMLKALATK
jgi:hypothetical protein